MAEAFTFFWKSPLSQWQRSPFVVGGVAFTHAEQFMMYAKALLFGDREAAAAVLDAPTPREQQVIGRAVRGFDEAVWVLFREGVVYQANYARFSQNPDQRELLFATRGTTLVEASPHDRVWGIGLAAGVRPLAVAWPQPARAGADPSPRRARRRLLLTRRASITSPGRSTTPSPPCRSGPTGPTPPPT